MVVTVPYIEMLVGRRTGMWGDTPTAYVPRYLAAWENIRNGDSPNWWGAMFGGLNALGTGQSAVYYLPNLVFGWFEAATAYRIWFFVHLWAMTAGWVFWSRRRWDSALGAFLTGVAGALNGYVTYHAIFMPYTAVLTLLPWCLLALDLLIERKQWRYVALFSLALGGMAVAGLPQLLWIVLIALGTIALAQVLKRSTPLVSWAQVGSGFLVGIALGAVQLLPVVKQGSASQRVKLDKEAAFEFAAAPRHLLTLLFPGILGGGSGVPGVAAAWSGGPNQHEVANYLGITCAALAVIGAVGLIRRRLTIALVLLALAGLLTALGGVTPLGDLTYESVPFANRFRAWSRNELWVNLAVLMLIGAGVRHVQEKPGRLALRLLAVSAVLAVLVSLLSRSSTLEASLATGSAGATARILPVILLAVLSAVLLITARRRVVGLALIGAVCAVDLIGFASGSLWRSEGLPPKTASEVFSATQPVFGNVVDDPGGLDRWVSDVADATGLWPTALGYPGNSVNGYDPLVNAEYALTVGDMAYNGYLRTGLFWSGGWLPDVLRTTTLYLSPYAQTPAPSWRYRSAVGDHTLWDYTPRLAESYLVGFAQPSTLDDARTGINNPDTRLTEFAYIDTSTVESTEAFATINAPGLSGTVSSGAMDDGGHGRWTVTADRPSLFVTSYAWMDGWSATVDGKRVPVARTNALVLGVPVPAGQHEIRLAFTPPGWTTGRNISIIAFVVVVLMLVGTTPPGRRVIDDVRRRLRRTPATATS